MAGFVCLGGGSAPRLVDWCAVVAGADVEKSRNYFKRRDPVRPDARLRQSESTLRPAGAGDVREGRRGEGV